jgi:hypothetical protein
MTVEELEREVAVVRRLLREAESDIRDLQHEVRNLERRLDQLERAR